MELHIKASLIQGTESCITLTVPVSAIWLTASQKNIAINTKTDLRPRMSRLSRCSGRKHPTMKNANPAIEYITGKYQSTARGIRADAPNQHANPSSTSKVPPGLLWTMYFIR